MRFPPLSRARKKSACVTDILQSYQVPWQVAKQTSASQPAVSDG